MALECTFVELDALGEALGLVLRRFPFTFPHYGNGIDRTALRAEVAASLAERGLLLDNRVASELHDTLTVFGTGEPSIGLLGTSGDEQLAALAVFGVDQGVLAVRQEEGVRFDFVPNDKIVPTLVDHLPPMRGALGEPYGRPRLGGGSFLVEGQSIGWVDTVAGRYLAVTSRGSDGRPRIDYWPGDAAALEQRLHSTLA
ncbi:ESX secretion-associated protein EspG [Kutzneria sp. CA-103260]|uniref:ESX secretion-associated protein EspG n=1 Tax=Kutzneria sp. CA-103260 TaxID=2802641 RepID=UPI001BAB36E6|nr:ESX secretion-associated protein EspG [Kutzneria sp. CA-103260]